MTAPLVLGVDAGTASLRQADHLLADLAGRLGLPDGALGCTHLIRSGEPHVAVSLTVEAGFDLSQIPDGFGAALGDLRVGPPALAEGAGYAATQHAVSGRAVRFAGAQAFSGAATVREILEGTAIDRIDVILSEAPGPDIVVHTRGHLRPEWRDGALVLVTMPSAGGTLTPFEVPDPTPCCADH